MLDPSLERFLSNKNQILSDESLWLLIIRIHITLAIIALITGPLGVIKTIRMKSKIFHRWNGRIYILSIALNYIPGIYVSFFATGGSLSTIGFLILNTLWLGTTLLSYRHIKGKNIIKHSQWITRSFMLSFANMEINIFLAISHNLIGFPYSYSYAIAVWLSWGISLVIAEVIIRKKVLI
ncbi:MAG: DUF2306 domain-containing protein [Heyndrickxia sp.]